jgi:hypothetical protein
MRCPSIFHIRSIAHYTLNHPTEDLVRMAGQPFFLKRLRAAWMVFTGRADALWWD